MSKANTNWQLIDHIVYRVREQKLTPTQLRYVCKRVREITGLIVESRPKRLPDFLNYVELQVLLKRAYEKDTYTGVLIEFLLFTGLRISEASRLMVQDIDFNNNQLKVVQGKGHKDRSVPLTYNLSQKLKLFLKNKVRGYVFGKDDQTKYSIRALQTRITNTIYECHFDKKLSTHSLRHTFACLCLSKGMKLEQIKLLMGHSSIKTTEIYAKLELGSIKDEFIKLMEYK
jgi:integrase/recombinase XerD